MQGEAKSKDYRTLHGHFCISNSLGSWLHLKTVLCWTTHTQYRDETSIKRQHQDLKCQRTLVWTVDYFAFPVPVRLVFLVDPFCSRSRNKQRLTTGGRNGYSSTGIRTRYLVLKILALIMAQ